MIVHQVYALIFEEKIQNVCVCDNFETANYIAKASYGNDAFAIDCLQYPCAVGDIYRNGTFYALDSETGEEFEIKRVPTQEEQVFMLHIDNDRVKESLTETQLALVESYEENLALQNEITNTQLAITELYERSLN